MYVIPAPYIDPDGNHIGPKRVHDPLAGDVLPPEGRDVPETEYWARRVRDGDVVLRDAAPALG